MDDVPRHRQDEIVQIRPDEWRITLGWSVEALAEAAFKMTFWYMGKTGEIVYSETGSPWEAMTPHDAGQNAVKMMLYYAVLRAQSARLRQKAIAVYNTYGFGYSLGMNFRNAEGRREMMWPEDLHEIAETGRTSDGCRIR